MENLLTEALVLLENRRDVVLVMILESEGSAPRRAGAKMLVAREGLVCGTIGGGAVEFEAVQMAVHALEEKCSYRKQYHLTAGTRGGQDLGMICGGDLNVYYQYLSHEDIQFQELCTQILHQCQKDEDAWILMDVTLPPVTEGRCCMELVTDHEALEPLKGHARAYKASMFMHNSRWMYMEPLVQEGVVYIFGGGHVAQELVPVLSHLKFRCIVLDDRAEFTKTELFPGAYAVQRCDFKRIEDAVTVRTSDYIVIMTRGHAFDYEVQTQVLRRCPRYIGIMGSASKIKTISERLRKDGFQRQEIEACHMPIGTDIQAETPAEIAISIAGELIQIRSVREKRKKTWEEP